MIATVLEINPNYSFTAQNGATHNCALLKLQGQKGERTFRLFRSHPAYKTACTLTPGQQVDVSLKKEGDYWQIVAIKPVSGGAAPKAAPSTTERPYGLDDHPNKSKRIAVSVALNAAALSAAAAIKAGRTVDEAEAIFARIYNLAYLISNNPDSWQYAPHDAPPFEVSDTVEVV